MKVHLSPLTPQARRTLSDYGATLDDLALTDYQRRSIVERYEAALRESEDLYFATGFRQGVRAMVEAFYDEGIEIVDESDEGVDATP